MNAFLRRSVLSAVTLLIAATVTAAPSANDPAAYIRDIEQQRAARVERLAAPQGWFSLVGLHWIEPGKHSIGRAADNGIVLATGPQHAGEIERSGTKVVYRPAHDAGITIDGHTIDGDVELAADSTGEPTTIAFDDGKATAQLIARGDRLGLRVRDERAETRAAFKGLDTYAIDPTWRIDARFEAHPPGKTIEIANVLDMLEATPNPGAVVFEKDGRDYRLEALDNGDGSLFLIFADRTNQKDTYGAGRFLYTDMPAQGRVALDFNLAVNPPCAFNAYSTCPLPPPENRLNLAVTAGEKRYAAANH